MVIDPTTQTSEQMSQLLTEHREQQIALFKLHDLLKLCDKQKYN